MPSKKPVAKRRGIAPKRQSSRSAKADSDARHARKRVKERLANLTMRISVIETRLGLVDQEIHDDAGAE